MRQTTRLAGAIYNIYNVETPPALAYDTHAVVSRAKSFQVAKGVKRSEAVTSWIASHRLAMGENNDIDSRSEYAHSEKTT